MYFRNETKPLWRLGRMDAMLGMEQAETVSWLVVGDIIFCNVLNYGKCIWLGWLLLVSSAFS